MSELVVPDGHKKGLPTVEVDPLLLEDYGEIHVCYEGLDEMFYRDLDVSRKKIVHTKLVEGVGLISGSYNPFSGALEVKPRVYDFGGQDKFVRTLLHEGKHAADFSRYPVRAFGEMAISRAGILGAAYLGAKYGSAGGDVVGGGLCGLLGLTTAFAAWNTASPLEIRARLAGKNQELLEKYQNVISFREWQPSQVS